MKENEIVQQIDDIEDQYPVNEWIMEGRRIWPLVKMILCDVLSRIDVTVDQGKKTETKQSLREKTARAFEYLRAICTYRRIRGGDSEVLIFHNNNGRNLLLDDGKRFDTCLDPFTLMLEPECGILSLEHMGKSSYRNTFRNTNIIDDIFTRDSLYTRLFRGKAGEEALKEYDIFLDGLSADLWELLRKENLRGVIRRINQTAASLERIIRKKKVQFVIAGCGYGQDTAALFMACKDANIQCMEVQHGIGAGSGHRWYTSWKKMPQNGQRYEMLPDIYWCWTKRGVETIESWAQGRHTAYAGNKPIYSVMSEVKKMAQDHAFSTSNGKPEILFSLQPEICYPEWIGDVIRKTCGEFNWVIRKHPTMDEAQERLISSISGISNVYVDGVESAMLEQLLMRAVLHITNHSTVALDAMEFGVKSIILSKKYEELFAEEIRRGFVFLGESEENTIQLIRQLCMDRNVVKGSFDELKKENLHFLRSVLTAG